MINETSRQAVDESRFSQQFRKPLYDSYCFSNIPQTILSSLTGEVGGLPADTLANLPKRYKKVILFFIDAFGWRFFEQFKDRYPILQKFVADGVVSKLTSQFPSTTAAHVTTMNTGLSVGQHGIYEWNYYEPTLDAVIAPLFFSYAGETTRETLVTKGVDPFSLFPHVNIHQKLGNAHIPSHVFQSADFAQSSYGDVVMKGSTTHPYTTLTQGLQDVVAQVKADETGFYYFYYATIDKMGHNFGLNSPEFLNAVDEFLLALEHECIRALDGNVTDTLFLMTADHGQVESNPKQCFYVNLEAPEIIPMLETLGNGQPIIPAGSARDFFLHVKPEYQTTVIDLLKAKLAGRAEVYAVADLIAQGFFGPLPLSDIFLRRVGNVVILPYANQSVWWFEEGRFWQKHTGHHGGLTPEEMETILYAYAF